MKKLELKNLKVKSIANQQLKEIKGGLKLPCENSAAMSCNQTSAWPINCNSAQAPMCWVDDDGNC